MEPMRYENNSNFKMAPYQAWIQSGGQCVQSYYGWRKLRPLLHVLEHIITKSKSEARLCFAEPPTLDVDTFPWWGHYEIIPVLWDCWPKFWDTTEKWFREHAVKSAVFTSSQTAAEFQHRFPEMNILTITEGIETNLYHGERCLQERSIDFLQFGRVTRMFEDLHFDESLHVVSSRNERVLLHTRADLIQALSDSKIVLAVPRCDMQPELAQGIETLTQRYWECMLSGVVILGRAPKELKELIGYDPVIPLDYEHTADQIKDIVEHISDYQELVDRNLQVAKQQADWMLRIRQIREWLCCSGYNIN